MQLVVGEGAAQKTAEAPEESNSALNLVGIFPALLWLDRLLELAVIVAQAAYGKATADPSRGLYVSQEEVAQMLA